MHSPVACEERRPGSAQCVGFVTRGPSTLNRWCLVGKYDFYSLRDVAEWVEGTIQRVSISSRSKSMISNNQPKMSRCSMTTSGTYKDWNGPARSMLVTVWSELAARNCREGFSVMISEPPMDFRPARPTHWRLGLFWTKKLPLIKPRSSDLILVRFSLLRHYIIIKRL